jgi:hypothetical protein
MSLNLTGAVSPGIATLDPAWAPKLRTYAELRDRQQNADAEARAAKAAADAAKAEILAALGTATAATCGNLIVSVKTGKDAPASVTLATGQKIMWEKVTSLIVGNENVPAADVQTLFGGRAGSVTLTIAG